MKKIANLLFVFLIIITFGLKAQEEGRLMRFPSIHGNQIVFSYAGDLFTVDKSGGVARKLTSVPMDTKCLPVFHPMESGYFTGQYDGNTEVYVIPAEGGVPQRLTYTATLQRDDISDRMVAITS